jgi:hypothetical protein
MQPFTKRNLITCVLLFALQLASKAQTDIDALMMAKHNFCVGGTYSYSSWTSYWEGTLKRDNLNLGRVSTNMFGIMGNYGITNKLNVLFSLPYVTTKASAGTLHGSNGLQDFSGWLKWMPVEKKLNSNSVLSFYGLAGFSLPSNNYQADYLPLSIGLHTSTISGRLMVDYQHKAFFATASGTYQYRSNIKIDRTAYYTTEMHLTNEVEMPDMAGFNVRTGIRTFRVIAEAFYQQNYTLGGFDITRNNMPFPSNRMNASMIGAHVKYVFKKLPALSVEAGSSYVVAGRNVGQATEFNGSVFYIIPFGHSKVSPSYSCKLCGLR